MKMTDILVISQCCTVLMGSCHHARVIFLSSFGVGVDVSVYTSGVSLSWCNNLMNIVGSGQGYFLVSCQYIR